MTAAVLEPGIFDGTVRHRRHEPVVHEFRQGLHLFWLDVDEDDLGLGRLSPLGGTSGRGPVRYHRDDHLRPHDVPLGAAVRALVQTERGVWHDGPIRMLGSVRTWGYGFNPITAYYCFDDDGSLRFLVTEVTNIPWGERTSYVLDEDDLAAETATVAKNLHVSPFFPMDHRYRMRTSVGVDRLWLRVENHTVPDGGSAGRRVFDADLVLARRPLRRWTLAALMVRRPWMTGQVAAGIHWQALRLWRKGVAYLPHPRPDNHHPNASSSTTQHPPSPSTTDPAPHEELSPTP